MHLRMYHISTAVVGYFKTTFYASAGFAECLFIVIIVDCQLNYYSLTIDVGQNFNIADVFSMTLNVYIASITANTEVRKHVQKVLMVLDGLGVPFKAIDITLRGNEQYRDFMRQNALNERCDGVPLPPQFFNYMDFEQAVEDNQLPEFLRLIPSSEEDEDDDEEEDEEDEEKGTSEDEISEKYDDYDQEGEDEQGGDEESLIDEEMENDSEDMSSGLGSSSKDEDSEKDPESSKNEDEHENEDEVDLEDEEVELEDESFEDEDEIE
ncbi:SH3-binding domain containing protein [Dirofilaria immitis]|nr:SH3-binding domain containing protein [Dirofilaria immitis]